MVKAKNPIEGWLKLITVVIWLYVIYLLFFASPAKAEPNVSGFGGYAWGVERALIRRELVDHHAVDVGDYSDWYAGELRGYKVTFGYVYDDNARLIGGAWDVQEHSIRAFYAIMAELAHTYGTFECTPDGCGGALEAPAFEDDGSQTVSVVMPDTVVTETLRPNESLTVVFKMKRKI